MIFDTNELYKLTNVGIFIVRKGENTIADVNSAGEKILGYTKEELFRLKQLPIIQFSGNFISGEYVFTKKNGKPIRLYVMVDKYWENDNLLVLFGEDITETKQITDQIVLSEKMNLIQRLTSNLAHELRNPLSIVLMNIQFLLENETLDQSHKENLGYAFTSANRIGQAIENALKLTEISDFSVQHGNINSILRNVLDNLRDSIISKDLIVEENFAEELPDVLVNTEQLYRAFSDLLTHICKVNTSGGKIAVGTGTLESLADYLPEQTHKLIVFIKDSGITLNPIQIQKLFEPYPRQKPGTIGIDLSLAKFIFDRHKIDVSIEPTAGGGNLYRLLFNM